MSKPSGWLRPMKAPKMVKNSDIECYDWSTVTTVGNFLRRQAPTQRVKSGVSKLLVLLQEKAKNAFILCIMLVSAVVLVVV